MKRWWGPLEKRRLATESGRDENGSPGGPRDETGDKTAAMASDEGELEFDEDEMAVLDFEGFHASEPAGNLSGENDSGSEAGRLSDAAAAAAYRTNPNLPD